MTGLDKIIRHIQEDAASIAGSTLKDGQNKSDEILAEALAEGNRKGAEILKQSEADVRTSLNRSKSAADLMERKLILEAKQQIIGQVIEDAIKTLKDMPEEEYFETILKMVEKYALDKKGEILFSRKDLERLPNHYEATINKRLSNNRLINQSEAFLSISKESKDIDGGFILLYGDDIEENCTFDALFLAAKESLQDKVNEMLFG
ncbi:MAG: hypothetical protein GX913_02575 [Clostridiales bacterium]|nr:hypothetical protein [Clostridiales bacterium]